MASVTKADYPEFVTLPISLVARAFAIVEGIFGQLYTAILIGKLVGMKMAQE